MRHLSDEDRAGRRRTLASIRYIIAQLVKTADQIFPHPGEGSLRHKWVTDTAKLVKTPAGDAIEIAVLSYLIELAVDEL